MVLDIVCNITTLIVIDALLIQRKPSLTSTLSAARDEGCPYAQQHAKHECWPQIQQAYSLVYALFIPMGVYLAASCQLQAVRFKSLP